MGLVVAFDTAVVLLTFFKTYRDVQLARRVNIGHTLSTAVLRDGESINLTKENHFLISRCPGLVYYGCVAPPFTAPAY